MDLEKFYDTYWANVGDSVDHERLDMIVKHVNPGSSVLEINCGIGILAQKILNKGADITVTDLSEVSLNRVGSKGIKRRYKVDIDTQELPFASSIFDTVVSNSMIEHTFFPENTIKEGVRVLKEGGKFILMVPNIAHWRFRLWLLFGEFPYLENTPTDTLHIRFFTLGSIKRLGEKNGLKVVNVAGSSGLWVRDVYPFFLRISPMKQIYELMTKVYPSLFARYLLIIFKNEKNENS